MPRTTLTLDADVLVLVRRRMEERSETFKTAVNATLRERLTDHEGAEHATPSFAMGADPAYDLKKALRLASLPEDDEILRKLQQGR